MRFANIPPVEPASTHLDIAFRRAKTRAELVKKRHRGQFTINRIREIERVRLSVASETLMSRFKKIQDSFPDMEALSPFYKELMKATLDIQKFNKAIGSLVWLTQKIKTFQLHYVRKINRSRTQTDIHDVRRSFYGRLSSVCEKLDGELAYLNDARKVMKTYPVIRALPTIAITGFPNVGKTTLLSKLSSSTPEIAEYAFTTKHVNLGYIEFPHKKIQLIDTPGTLARPDKMNAIEQQAVIAIKYLAHALIYVFDPTEPYPLEKQELLLEILRKENKPLLLYMSKADMAKEPVVEKKIEEIMARHNEIISSPELLKQQLQALV
ncbi:50S ribosome-binding GTPase [Candidatus Woesearchaeota archaeon]|nr:50S ribosome-binding GTPase [Candidatus Woesearchaeota archaeon]